MAGIWKACAPPVSPISKRNRRRLTPAQRALLLALPQAPEARRPDRRPDAARAARAQILTRLADQGGLPAQHAREAAQEPVPARRPFPQSAHHAARRLARDEDRRRRAACIP